MRVKMTKTRMVSSWPFLTEAFTTDGFSNFHAAEDWYKNDYPEEEDERSDEGSGAYSSPEISIIDAHSLFSS